MTDAASRILLVGPCPPPVGGMERAVELLAASFPTSNPSGYAIDLIDANGLSPLILTPKVVKRWNHARVLRQVTKALPHCALVHVVTAWGDNFWRAADVCELALTARKPIVLHLQSGKFATWFAEQDAAKQVRIRNLFARLSALVVLSPGWIGQLRDWAPEERFAVIPNVADPVEWPYVAHPGPVTGERPFRWVTAGRLEQAKGTWDLLQAIATLVPGSTATRLYGRGMPDGTRERLSAAGGQLELAGEVPPLQLRAGYAWADAFVFPSHYEGLPLALVEAMLSGLPVIATRVGAIPEMLADLPHDQTIPPHDPEALREAMSALMALPPSDREMLGRANHDRALARYSVAALEAACIATWDSVLARC